MRTSIDRASLLPFYYQLKEILVDDIQRRQLQAGDRLPSDHELCAQHGVSRTVVRQALSELEAEGVLERVKGRGTFVSQHKTAEGLAQSLTGLFEDVAARGATLRSEVQRLEVVPADAAIAADLDLAPGSPVTVLERLRFVDGEPWVYAVTHVPESLAPGLTEEDLEYVSLYAVLERRWGVRLVHGQRSIEATVANAAMARRLGVSRGAPLLVLRSVSFGEAERPVETFTAYHRADRSRFVVNLVRKPGRAARSQPLVHMTR